MDNARLRFWLAPFAHAGDIYVIDDVRMEKMDGSESDLPTITAQSVDVTASGMLLGMDEAPFDPALLDLVDEGNVVDEEAGALQMFLPWVQR